MRAAAARSLRLVSDPRVDDILARTLGGDADSDVRAAAAFAMRAQAGKAITRAPEP